MAEEQEVKEKEEVETEIETEVETEVQAETEEQPKAETLTEETKGKEEELEQYSKGVQSRIKKLTEKYRQEERDKNEAVTLSQKLIEENQKLKTRVQALDSGFVTEYGTRLAAQEEQAKRLYKEAYEAGDADKMSEANKMLAGVAVEQQKYNTARVRLEQQAKQPQQTEQQNQQPQAQTQTQAQPDPRAQKWASDNNWFGNDKIMTTAAFTLHNILTNEEGFDAQSEEYYSEIDKRIRLEFPHKFSTPKKTNGTTQVASASNSASRSNKQGRRVVRLTPSQVAIAKKLGLTPEQYAKHVKD